MGLDKRIVDFMNHRIHIFLIGLSFIIFLSILTIGISEPYSKEWEIGFQEKIALNHLNYGLKQTNFLSVTSVLEGDNLYHLNHPPLVPLLIAGSFYLFGVSEVSARLVPILFSLLNFILIYFISKKLFNKKVALFSCIVFTFMPMSSYFGRIVNFEVVTLFFILFVAYNYICWIQDSKINNYVLAIIGIVFGSMSDWPFYLLLPLLLLYSIITKRKIISTMGLLLTGIGMSMFYFYIINKMTGNIGWWFTHANHRQGFDYFLNEELYARIIARLWKYMSIVPLISGTYIIYFVIKTGKQFRKKFAINNDIIRSLSGTINKFQNELMLIIIFYVGVLYIFLFPQSTFVHTWQMFYILPGVSITAGVVLSKIFNYGKEGYFISLLLTCIIILFSANTLIQIHEGSNPHSYNLANYINQNTNQYDYIANSHVLTIPYYLESTNIQKITNPPDLDKIKIYKPKFVIYQAIAYKDSNFNRKDINQFLLNEYYIKISNNPIVWIKMNESHKFIYSGYENFMSIKDDVKVSIFEHPENSKETMIFLNEINVTENSSLKFSIGLHGDVYQKSDGAVFKIKQNDIYIFEHYLDPKRNLTERKWMTYEIPIDSYESNNFTLITTCGPNDDCSYDWAYWGEPKIIVKMPNNNSAS